MAPRTRRALRRHGQIAIRICALAVGGLAFFGAASALWGQDATRPASERPPRSEVEGGASAGRPVARAARRQGSIRIDGRLDEPTWRAAPAVTSFVQGEPTEGAPPAEATEVRVLFDDGAIYVGARLHESDPSAIRNQLVRRDEEGQYDYFEVSLDPNLDGLTGYRFRVSAAGAESDAVLFNDTGEDREWDAVWDSGVHRDSLGWSVEMRIPLSQIRYESAEGPQTWGVNFARRRLASTSISYFSLESRTQRGRVSQFGRLDGLELPGRARRLELKPFAVSQLTTRPGEEGNPLLEETDLSPRLGLDLSYGVGSNYSLDLTVNPDFGQVEVDPEVINLTAFETFFPEKRPFFVQDARVFDFELAGRRNTLFFSRRIGRSPGGEAPEEAAFSRRPGQTTILGAGKFTGRTPGGLSVGGLFAVTDREMGRAFFPEGDTTRRFVAEPAAEYGVVRLQQDLREGASRIGLIATALDRRLPADGSFSDLASQAYSLGLDFEHAWGGPRNRDWRLFGHFATSLVRGAPEAIVRIQESSNHFFQRPDADHLEVDSTANSIFGSTWRLQFERQSARHWTWAVWLGEISPGFEVNDLGFMTDGERLDAGARLSYRQIRPGPLFREYRVSFFTFHNWRHTLLDDPFSARNFARAYKDGAFVWSGSFTFLNNWSLEGRLSYGPQSLSDTETRGGPLMTEPASIGFRAELETDPRNAVSLSPEIDLTHRSRRAGSAIRAGLGLSLRPSSAWELRLSPTYRRETDAAQFVTSSDEVPFEPTFGSRYFFADLVRNELSLETRLSLALSPDVSLQLFVQPLVSAGRFVTYKQLLRPASFEFLRFAEGTSRVGPDGVSCEGGTTCVRDGERYLELDGTGPADLSFEDRDFNIRSLRGNAVFRWEYRSGSTLFLVWQQSRREEREFGDFSPTRDLGGIFSAPATNTFIVKVSHYLGL